MVQYAIIKDGTTLHRMIEADSPPEVATHKGFTVLPVEEEVVDNSTINYTNSVVENLIEPTRYLIRTTISDKTQPELDIIYEAEKDYVIDKFDEERDIVRALALTLFDAVNEIRVLKAQAPLTMGQFKAYVRGKL